jgi:GntR family transcriptional repressor for pyruvate dehydrogenase complex
MLKPLARDTLTVQAADTIRRFILSEDLVSGVQLPSERELSEILSVSRNIVREALSALVAEGLIVKQAGRGIFVTDFDRAEVMPKIALTVDYDSRDLSALAEARTVVELGAVDLMVERITEDQLAQLAEINGSLTDNLRSGRSTIKDDIEFHTVLLQSTHNAVIVDLIPLLVEFFRLSVLHRPMVILNNPERIIDEHQKTMDALTGRDPIIVREALISHLHPDDMPVPESTWLAVAEH